MLNNVQNNQPAFTSTVRMTQKTAKELYRQPKRIQRALMKDIRTLSSNGRNDVINLSFKEVISVFKGGRKEPDVLFSIFERKFLTSDVIEKRGNDYFSAKASKIITAYDDDFEKPLKLIDLYRTARQKMKPVDTVSNKFMEFV